MKDEHYTLPKFDMRSSTDRRFWTGREGFRVMDDYGTLSPTWKRPLGFEERLGYGPR